MSKRYDVDPARLNPGFDPEKVCKQVVESIKEYFDTFMPGGKAIIGISGGKDSTVTAMLCTLALGKDRVIGVLMPNGKQKDIADAYTVVETLDIEYHVRYIDELVQEELTFMEIQNSISPFPVNPLPSQVTDNIPPRIRMTHLYATAALKGGLVMNTCNLSEDWVGYSTKFGDSAGDYAPLACFTVGEVVLIGEYAAKVLGSKKLADLCFKTPSDGLCGKTDEDNLGFTYEVLDKYLRTGICEDKEIRRSIDERHVRNLHKVSPMPRYEFGDIATAATCFTCRNWAKI